MKTDNSPKIHPFFETKMQKVQDGQLPIPCLVQKEGMTLLQYYAGQALAGVMSYYADIESDTTRRLIARKCKLVAEAMVKEILE